MFKILYWKCKTIFFSEISLKLKNNILFMKQIEYYFFFCFIVTKDSSVPLFLIGQISECFWSERKEVPPGVREICGFACLRHGFCQVTFCPRNTILWLTSINIFNYFRKCLARCLDESLVKGKILVCASSDGLSIAHSMGAVASIIINPSDYASIHAISFSALLPEDFDLLVSYINSTR